MAATAAARLGLAPRFGQLDRTRVHVDGRDHSDDEPAAPGVPSTRGDSRAHRPDRHHVLVALMVAPHAGLPLLMHPRSGHRREADDVGEAVRAPLPPLPTPSGMSSRGADSALDSKATLHTLAQTPRKWITRVPATVSGAQALRAQAAPQRLASRNAGSPEHAWPSRDGGIEHCWSRLSAELRQAQARRTVDTPWRQQSDPEPHAVKTLCRTTVAGEADARQALSTFAPALPPIALAASTVRAPPREAPRGRPRSAARPDQVVYPIDGALASALTVRQALIDPHGCVILATKALDTAHRPPHERLAGDKGRVHGARGCRCWQDPQCFASSLDLNTPERLMALRMAMPVCVLVDAALAYRSRHARNAPAATCPDQRGTRLQQPTARWVFHAWGGIHWRCQAGPWPIVLNRTAAHQHWLRLLGQPYLARYDVQ